MKTNFFFRTVLVIVLAMVTEVSMAQRVVNGIDKGWSTRQAGKYLVSNPSDTVILAVSEVIRDNGIRYVETRIGYVIEGKLVSRRDTVLYFEKMSNDISQENKKNIFAVKKMLICLNTNGQISRTFTVSMYLCSVEQIILTGK